MCFNVINNIPMGIQRRTILNGMENELTSLKQRRTELTNIIRKLKKIKNIDSDENENHIDFVNYQDELVFLRKEITKQQRIKRNYDKNNKLPLTDIEIKEKEEKKLLKIQNFNGEKYINNLIKRIEKKEAKLYAQL
jgi:hypothetical protein